MSRSLKELHLFILPTPDCSLRQIVCVQEKEKEVKEEKNLPAELEGRSVNVSARKLLFTLVSLSQQKLPSHHGAKISFSRQRLITLELSAEYSCYFNFFVLFSVSPIHQGLPRNAGSVLIWSLVSSMWLAVIWTVLWTSKDAVIPKSHILVKLA